MDPIAIESLAQLFHHMVEKGASDMHLQVGSPPVFRIKGSTIYLKEYDTLVPENLKKITYERLNEKQITQLEKTGDLDLAIGIQGLARFRLNIFHQRSTVGLVARLVPSRIKTTEELHLPSSIDQFCQAKDGLVIVSGATGSGKSTTLAAIIESINQQRACHILSIEDPIEYLYRNKKAYINQREVGIDVGSFQAALRVAVRQDPDVIMVGEMRDQETFEFGLSAAETGHLVFGTLHSSNVPQTISRILDLFPHEKHTQIRQSLHFNLRGIVCQKLLPAIDEDVFQVPAVELMFNNAVTKKLIKEGEDAKLYKVIESATQEGMQTFNRSLLNLSNDNLITNEVALKNSPNPDELKMNLQGIFLSKSGLVGG